MSIKKMKKITESVIKCIINLIKPIYNNYYGSKLNIVFIVTKTQYKQVYHFKESYINKYITKILKFKLYTLELGKILFLKF